MAASYHIRGLTIAACILAAACAPVWGATPQPGLTTSALAGSWIISFDNGTHNALALTTTGGRLAGTYVSDDNSSCPVTGTLAAPARAVSLHVRCLTLDFTMQGTASPDGREIAGRYSVLSSNGRGDVGGTYRIVKSQDAAR
jgi:hypothetical protein